MVNVIPPNHVDDVPVVEPNQHDDVPVVPEPVLVDEDKDPKEEEFEEEREPQEKEDDMEVDIEEDENEPELTYPYEEDETIPASVHEVGESSTAPFLREDIDGLLPGLMRRDINSLFGRMASLSRRLCGRDTTHALVEKKEKAKDEYYGKLILELGNEVHSSMEQGTAAMEKLVERLGNVEEKAECKKLKKELEEARKYTVLAVCQIVHCGSGLSFLTAVSLIRQKFVSSAICNFSGLIRGGLQVYLKTFSHSDLRNKPLPISFLGSSLVFLLHSGLPFLSSSGLAEQRRSGLSLVAVYSSGLLQGRQNRGQGNNTRGAGVAGYRGPQNRVGNANSEYFKDKMLLMQAHENRVALDEAQLLFIAGGQDNAVDEDVDEQPVQDLALNVDNVFQADDCDAFDFDPSYDSDILSEVHGHDQYQDAVCEHHEPTQHVSVTTQNYVVDKLLAAELATYKEQVELYERRAKFELTEREQKIDEQLRIVITDFHMLCKPKSYYDEQNKVAIGYKNPLYLTRAQQVQAALYNGHEIIKTNHVQAIVHNSKETLEITEITRKKMNDKMKDPECVQKEVTIAPHDYSKENYLATFTPQKQLTPEQIFWSKDLLKMKAESLKEQTIASKPIKSLTVYPTNTPATLVPKRITPTGLTEGGRGFEQTKECYLTKVILFFKTLKDHFEGIQKALTKEIKEIKEIFTELESEVDQNVMHRKHDEIERKNLLITNDNLIADCLSNDVFYTATDFVLTVSRFSDMHEALSAAKKRIAKLESEKFNLQNKIQNDDHDVMVYRKACHLLVELEHKAYKALKHANFDLKTADDHRKVKINELNELHDQANENSLIYKDKTKRLHDSKIKNRVFNIGVRVLLFNSRLKIFSGKHKSRWSGPFTISQVYPYVTVELSQPDGPNFKVNGHRVKHYFGEDVPKMVVPDL
nr:reverse transcriptase domain-containing protein [Tanacetum cinerariifolium]